MSLFVASLNSGSNGNCYYVGTMRDAVLIDAGISCRETEKRMRRLGLSMDKVRAIFISHEHIDHIKGVEVLSSRYQLPVYITPVTLQYSRLSLDAALVRSFSSGSPVTIGSMCIHAFSKQHDAFDPHSFMISFANINVGVFTDIGAPCDNLVAHFRQCHAAFLETNYDDVMLQYGKYPPHLKKRISGDKGHLSNAQALSLFNRHKPAFMSHVFLSHLSQDNNNPEVVQQLFRQHAGDIQVIVASRHEETAVYRIEGQSRPVVHDMNVVQASLF